MCTIGKNRSSEDSGLPVLPLAPPLPPSPIPRTAAATAVGQGPSLGRSSGSWRNYFSIAKAPSQTPKTYFSIADSTLLPRPSLRFPVLTLVLPILLLVLPRHPLRFPVLTLVLPILLLVLPRPAFPATPQNSWTLKRTPQQSHYRGSGPLVGPPVCEWLPLLFLKKLS